ncbi:MAG: hypothetical protein P4N24_03765 [Acidobacteriota bacterium]|nr:hypothetical protein [Acidobacteriota bacterium]
MKRRKFLHQVAASLASAPLVARAGIIASEQASPRGQDPIRVNSARQLFIDNALISGARGVRLVLNRPYPTGERCVVADKPWESLGVWGYNSVIEDDGVLKLWYDAIASDGSRWSCLATSQDGVHWEKPNLGIVPFKGSNNTNIVFPPVAMSHEPNCVFKDTNPACPPSEQYKMVANLQPPGGKKGTYVAASPDGAHWKLMKEEPAFRASDTNNICFFDNRIGRYVGYVRVWDVMRKVGRCEFDDITDWGKEQMVFSYDAEDLQELDSHIFSANAASLGASAIKTKPRMDFYTSAAWKYPRAEDVYLMFPSAYYHFQEDWARRRGTTDPRNDGTLDVQFATSRDGKSWFRLDRHPFIRLGVAGGFASATAYMASGCICRPEEIWFYYGASDHTHGNYDLAHDRFLGTITRARMRLDGFASVDAEYSGGEFTTPPLPFTGNQLSLNTDTSAGGHVRVELQDESAKPLAGFSADDCDPINGNFIQKVVSWRGHTGMQAWAGRPVRLRFVMRDAKLYSFKFD